MPKKQTTAAARARAAARTGQKYTTALRQQQTEPPGIWHGAAAEPSESDTAVSVPKWLSLELARGQLAQQQLAQGGPSLSSWRPGMADDVNPVCGCHLRAQCAGCGVCTTCDGCYCGEGDDDAYAARQEAEHYEHREHDPECYSCEIAQRETADYTRCPKCALPYPDGRPDHIAHNPPYCRPLPIWPTSIDWTYLIGKRARFVGFGYDVNGLVLDEQPKLKPGAYYPYLEILRTDPGYEGESPINPRQWSEIHPAPPTVDPAQGRPADQRSVTLAEGSDTQEPYQATTRGTVPAASVSGPPDDGFGGHGFEYERDTDLFRCTECQEYEVSARAEDGTITACTGLVGFGGDTERVYLLVTEYPERPGSSTTFLATRIRSTGIGRTPRYGWRDGRLLVESAPSVVDDLVRRIKEMKMDIGGGLGEIPAARSVERITAEQGRAIIAENYAAYIEQYGDRR